MTAFAALADCLRELAGAIRPLTAEAFTSRPLASSGSIGGHVRHCLDHVWALERGIATGEICYDHRERDTAVEHNLQLALSRLTRAISRMGGLGDYLLDRPLRIVAQLHADGRAVHAGTTVGRELAFVISHTIHHCALIAVLLEHGEHDMPARFGLAPTTPLETVCAR